MTALEIAVQDPDGVAVAARAGADRVELCSALALGGLTPSRGFVKAAADGPMPVHVLIRPRPGGFVYSSLEQDVILADIRYALADGAAGVVVGATIDGSIDERFLARMREAAGTSSLTFHRAFDTLTDQKAAIEMLVAAGVDRVLTSGGKTAAPDALEELRQIVACAAGRVQVMAGGGVNEASVDDILATGVTAVHASAKRAVPDLVSVGLGDSSPAGAPTRDVTDFATVRALRAAIDSRAAK